MKYDFTLRLYNYDKTSTLGDINNITISGITLISKPSKGDICYHKGNQKKFNYSFKLSKLFSKWAGSHNHPILYFKGEYIDIHIKNFPRHPMFYQDTASARNYFNGYDHSNLNKGFPNCLLYREVKFLNIKSH